MLFTRSVKPEHLKRYKDFALLLFSLSCRPDLVPPAYAQALARLQDGVTPFPLAAASIAQVHRATLRDGRGVAVKVQRPGIREQVLDDLEAMGGIASFLAERTELGRRYDVDLFFAAFRKSLLRELDFRQEAIHLTARRCSTSTRSASRWRRASTRMPR